MFLAKCQEKRPSLSSVGRSLGSRTGGRGKGQAAAVWVWGLTWAGSTGSHTPPGSLCARGRRASERCWRSHKPPLSLGGPQSPGVKTQHAGGQRGPAPTATAAAEPCSLLSHWVESLLSSGFFSTQPERTVGCPQLKTEAASPSSGPDSLPL